ncbi:XrtA/PEP-CTERM system TPR-repeat protein PrsT [Candidatus Accumulibacter sp. ACC007]|uniref:XrtA/PEP-CTERM system TPR-repeat protein PrsT n=1 Tax=Candidatus Accumulibacter sp. ACC007 TaxID=2823333 RepID=UPI0025BC7CE9|nr:XrtA/PEP-CTERM system TPR-repeat protein PrsT [Candidatus Accumulibacter sp. ACC007]
MPTIDRTITFPLRAVAAMIFVAVLLLSGCAEKPEAMLASAKESLARNDRNTAVIQLKNALQENPDLAEARFLLGKALLDSGEVEAAEKELRRAAELGYPADMVAPSLARALLARGDHERIAADFARTDLASPEARADLKTTLGHAHLASGNFAAARGDFAAALAAVPEYPPALLGTAGLNADAGDLLAALAMIDTALAKSPALYAGWQLKGRILEAQKRPDLALAAYRKALEISPDYLPAHWAVLALLLDQGKSEDAGGQLALLQARAPKHPQTFYFEALLAVSRKDFAAARNASQQQLGMVPNDTAGLLLGGYIDTQLGSYVQAEKQLLKVLKDSPNQALARLTLVRSYLLSRQPSKAMDALKPMLENAASNADVLALAGEVYAQNGDTTAAVGYFEKAAALDPTSAERRTDLALSRMASGEGERGLRELEQSAASDTGIRADLALIATSLQRRNYDAALAAVVALEKKQADTPVPHKLRGTVLAARGDMAGARRSFERAAALDAGDFGAAASLARLDLADKKPDAAKKRFESVLAKDPKNVQAMLAMAELRARGGEGAGEVAALIDEAVSANPVDAAPRLALIAHYLRSNEPKKAITATQAALAALPERPEILEAAGQAYQAAGDSNQAKAMYLKLAQLRPRSPLPLLRLAELQIAANDNVAAQESVRKALAIEPDRLDAQRAMIVLDLRRGRSAEALAAARDLQKRWPKESAGYLLEGGVLASTGAVDAALAAYRAGLKQVGTPDLAIQLHAALVRSGKGQEADSFSATWLKEQSLDVEFRSYRAQIALDKKDYALAARLYKQLQVLQPDDVPTLNNLAWVAGQLKDPEALAYARKAASLAPGNAAVLDTLGTLLVDKGDLARGLELLQKASALAPDDAAIRLDLARALVKAGQKDVARKELDTLASLGSTFPAQDEVARLLQGL